jgi:hypothetical protein
MQLNEMQRIMLECQRWELGVHAASEKKTVRIALCTTVQLFAACHQTRADAHQCLDLAFDRVRGEDPVTALGKAMASLAVVGNAQGISLEMATMIAPRVAKPLWLEWRAA